MATETRQKEQALSREAPFVLFSPEETTLSALPFFSIDTGGKRSAYHIDYDTRLVNRDVSATLRWRVSGDPVYGFPDPFDRRIFKTVEYLAIQQNGLPLRHPILISLAQVLDLVVWRHFQPISPRYGQPSGVSRRLPFAAT